MERCVANAQWIGGTSVADRSSFYKSLDLLKGTGGTGRSSIQYQPGTLQFQAPQLKPIDLTQGKIDYSSLPSLKSPATGGGNGKPWWMDTLNTLQGIGSIVIDPLARATDGDSNTKWYDHFKNIGTGYMDSWSDGKLNMGDIFGGLMYAGENAKTGQDLLNNTGWKEGEAQKGWNPLKAEKGQFDIHDLASLAVDIFGDPTTYLTFGGASAIKAGGKAITGAAKDVAQRELIDAGVNLTGKELKNLTRPDNLTSLAERAAQQRFQPHIQAGADSDIIQQSMSSFQQQLLNQIENAGKAARNTAQNNLINFDIPLTNVTKGFGAKPSFLQVNDAKIGDVGASRVTDLFRQKGVTDSSKQLDVIKSTYGVNSIEDMTKQMLEHFNTNVKGLPAQSTEVFSDIFSRMPKFVEDARPLKGKQDIAEWLAPRLQEVYPNMKIDVNSLMKNKVDVLKQLSDQLTYNQFGVPVTTPVKLEPFGQSAPVTQSMKTWNGAESMKTNLNVNKFVQDMGGKSKVGKYVSDKLLQMVNPRTLGTGNDLVNTAAGSIRDAENFIRGNYAQMNRDMKDITDSTKGLSKTEQEYIPYIVEGKYPNGQTKEDFFKDRNVSPDKLAQLEETAQKMRNLFDKFAQREQGVGALGSTRGNYFPHVLGEGFDEDALMKFINDPEVQKWLGRSSSNRFNQKRTGFQTFADYQDALTSLENAKKQLTDADEIERIEAKIEQLKNLLETDPIEATSKRYRANIRITAMKELQNHFEDMGYLVKPKDARNRPHSDEFKTVTSEISKDLGVPEGSLIHKDVLNALGKVESLFTVEGMNTTLKELHSATNIWKTLVTTLVPSHHFYNLIGNVANNSMAGVTPANYRQSAKLLKGLQNNTLTVKEQKIIQSAYDKGILHGGSMIDNMDPLMKEQLEKQGIGIGKAEVKVNEFLPVRAGRHVGNSIDDFTRLALYVKGLKQTGSSDKAADLVRRYLFNYGELTNADKGIKVMIPFWNWTKNNIPLQLTEFVRQPRYYQTFMDIQNMFNDGRDTEGDPEFTQDWLNIGGNFVNPRIPLQDLSKVDDSSQLMLGGLSPFVKIPIERELNKQFFNGQPIEYGKDPNAPYSLDANAEYFANQTGLPGRFYKYNVNDENALMDTLDLLFGYRNYNFNQ